MNNHNFLKFINTDNDNYFELELNQHHNYFYFPLTNESFHASITPKLAGDSCVDLNSFYLKPMTMDDLFHSNYSRNFWVKSQDHLWSATGNSLLQKQNKDDHLTIQGGFLWHKTIRKNEKIGLKSEILNFIPSINQSIELMQIKITNINDAPQICQVSSAIPIYGRSADNIRDHNHVTSLLNQIEITDYGVVLKPTLSFDERGHTINSNMYQFYMLNENLDTPDEIYPLMDYFVGDGSLDWPDYLTKNSSQKINLPNSQGLNIIGAVTYFDIKLKPNESVSYFILMGISVSKLNPLSFLSVNKFNELFEDTKKYWNDQISSLSIKTSQNEFDNWLDWVSIQPILRRIYGNSYLPHHDYGRGGRGWRDLWQDILSLLLIENKNVRSSLISNFAGVRIDGSNATIIGNSQGEFIADRNNIPRVWMDHGAWPTFTINFYIHQTGDFDILFEKQIYFADKFSHRSKKIQTHGIYSDNKLRNKSDEVHFGSIIEHLILQNITSSLNLGEHHSILLEDGDWNDGLDMANEKGESVAFTSFYASNLRIISNLLREIKSRYGYEHLSLTKEIKILLNKGITKNLSQNKDRYLLTYFDTVENGVSGEYEQININELIKILNSYSELLTTNIISNEIVNDNKFSWLNGYYDNNGKKVEGKFGNNIRMTLTGQTFPLMSKILDQELTSKIISSVNYYLLHSTIKVPRLNTDFKDLKIDLGRAFGFAYGHKENGAIFSHMVMMYVYSLYLNEQISEGYQIINSLFDHLIDTNKSRIYPNLPEYINQQGYGMYSYLTGSASWLILIVITQMYGIRGHYGDLIINPKLTLNQFINNKTSIKTIFQNINLQITFINNNKQKYGSYSITKYTIQGKENILNTPNKEIKISVSELSQLKKDNAIEIDIFLD